MSRPSKPTNEMLGFVEDEHGALTIGDIVIPPPPVAALSYDVPDKRLIITQLKIKNFKSYAGEVVLGPFNKNFTAVVGPNGSGKSNVIDSLLFVFGYRAKKIRSKKVSHLIHKSDQYPDVRSCTVTVQFAMIKEMGDSYEIIPGTTFVLSRTAMNDDSSYYEMGRKRVQYKEVARALRRYGIDLDHSRFLILQGEIEAISLMQPKGPNEHECGMLEYIEDIIGSNRYIIPLQQLSEKLEKLKEETAEKLANLKLVEKEKEDLEEPKNKAIEYLRLQNMVILNENSLLHCKRHSAEKELEEIVESKKVLFENVSKLKADISELKKSRKSKEEELEEISRKLQKATIDSEKYKELFKNLEREDVALLEEIKHLRTKKSDIETNLSNGEAEVTKLKKQSETYKSETEELKQKKEKFKSEKTTEEQKMSEVMKSVKIETTMLQEQKDKLEAELLIMKKQVYQLNSEVELMQSELDICLKTEKRNKENLEKLNLDLQAAETSSKQEKRLLDEEEKKILELKTEHDICIQNISNSQAEDARLIEELTNVRLKLDDARSSVSTFKHRSGMLQAFAAEKAKGNLTGVYGRLGDLGGIDEKYDIAISTACARLDNIVTDTLATAQKCVEYLKRNNLGYATFIPLDKMETWVHHANSKIVTPENVPRLFDLVRVKDKNVLPAFYYALRDTLVADNLEQATRIGLQGSKRYRVVTLKGELIDLTGTMSGGGGKVFKGRMGQTVVESKFTQADVSRLAEEERLASLAVTTSRKNIHRWEEQISRITRQLPSLKLSVKKRESNYKAYLENIEILKIQIEQQKKKMETTSVDEEKVAGLKERIQVKSKSYQESADEAKAVEEKVSKLQKDILKTSKGSLTKYQKKIAQLGKDIDEVTQNISKSSVNSRTCEKKLSKIEDKMKTWKRELEGFEEKTVKLKNDRDNIVKQGKEHFEKQKEAEAAVEKLKPIKVELKQVLKTFDEKEQQLKLDEIDQKNKLKEKEGMESESRGLIKNYTARLAKLKLGEVEDDPTEIPTLSVEEIEKLSVKKLLSDSELLKVQLEDMQVNVSAIAEYKKKEKICNEKQKDLDDAVQERNMQNMRCETLRERRYTEFMKGFTVIAKKLKETYQMLTLGGDAEMEIVETFDPFAKGIEFSVRPPRKSWKFMRNLSGGEKTLSSLALVFALHYYRPTPFYVMDEIDAALDVRNVAIVGFYLKECTKNTQFIIVSLRNIMNELSDHLIGIYKTDNCSKNISIKNASKWKEEDENNEKQRCSVVAV